jgi:hypothetical protein
MCSSVNIVFNLKQNTQHYITINDVRPAIDFTIIRLARVLFEFEIHGLGGSTWAILWASRL